MLLKKDIEILENHRFVYSDQTRVAQVLKLKKEDVEFCFINTHLTHLIEALRVQETLELIEFVKKFGDLPMICTGDFNYGPTTLPYATMSEIFRSAMLDANGVEPEFTIPTDLEDMYEADMVHECIDYI